MKKEERKHRFALTLLVSIIIFILQLCAIVVAALVVYLLIRFGLMTQEDQGVGYAYQVLFFMSLISLILGAMLTAVCSYVYLKPINRLLTQMNLLAAGDFKARLSFGKPISSHSAFQEVSASFNKMAEALESTEMLRSDFINNFSHEFKTPIVSISGFAKLLKRGDLTPEQQLEYLDIIEAESLRLAAMANNVLDLTTVENQTILTDVSQYNLSEQIRNSVLLLLEGKWAKKDIDFSLEFEEYTIMANEELLKQVWINLLDNAIKFSPEGGTVGVNIQEQGSILSVTVTNTGSTIPAEKVGKIFNKFYQADESHSSEGNGIGLALVKKIVTLHEGSISVQSDNNATAFTVSLPKIR